MLRWTTRGCAGALLVMLALAGVSGAHAAPGDHIRAGDAEIIPSVMTGFEAHSNVYLSDGNDQAEYPGLAWVIKPSVGVKLENDKVQLDAGVGWAGKKYIDFHPDQVPNLENADQWTDFTANLGVNALTKSLVGLHLDDKFEVQNYAGELASAEGSANITHVSNDANGGIAIRPGSALEIGLLGNFGLDSYTLPDALAESGNPNINNRANYGPLVTASWRFLPKTSLVGSLGVNWTNWENNIVYAIGPDVEGVDYGSYVGKPDALAWRTSWGVRGQFTQKLALGAEVGYGQMYYDEQTVLDGASELGLGASSEEISTIGDDTFARDLTSFSEGLLVNLQAAYAPLKNHKIVFGYRKDFQDAFFTNYVAFNYLFLRYEGLVLNRLTITGEVKYRIDAFHGEVARDDQNISARVGAAWNATDYLSAGLAGGWSERACLDPK